MTFGGLPGQLLVLLLRFLDRLLDLDLRVGLLVDLGAEPGRQVLPPPDEGIGLGHRGASRFEPAHRRRYRRHARPSCHDRRPRGPTARSPATRRLRPGGPASSGVAPASQRRAGRRAGRATSAAIDAVLAGRDQVGREPAQHACRCRRRRSRVERRRARRRAPCARPRPTGRRGPARPGSPARRGPAPAAPDGGRSAAAAIGERGLERRAGRVVDQRGRPRPRAGRRARPRGCGSGCRGWPWRPRRPRPPGPW